MLHMSNLVLRNPAKDPLLDEYHSGGDRSMDRHRSFFIKCGRSVGACNALLEPTVVVPVLTTMSLGRQLPRWSLAPVTYQPN